MNPINHLFKKSMFWIVLSLALATMLTLAACGGSSTAQSNSTAAAPTAAATPTAADTPTPVPPTPTPTKPAPTPTTAAPPKVAAPPKAVAPPKAAAPSATVVQVKIVEINNKYSFQPATITVTKGSKIVWTNTSDAPHTVTSDTNAFAASSTLMQNQTFTMVVTTSGTYTYHCTIHPYMQAKIVVTS